MYQDSYAEIYERVMQHRDRDYAGEAAAIAKLVRERCPRAASLLDVCCGPGLHLQHLGGEFTHVAALDASEEMLALAATRVPGLRCHRSDMREVDLDARFDVITCMFALPHLETAAELDATVARLARHLTPGGVLVLEPWYEPAQFIDGYVATDVVRDGQRRSTVRLSHSTFVPGSRERIRMVVHYADAGGGAGVRHATETVDLSLFSGDRFRHALTAAGCDAEHVTGAPFAWGVWVGRHASARAISMT